MNTKVIKVDPINPSEEDIKEAAELIVKGELVVFPTETVYGLGADATNSNAVKKIFLVKRRPIDNPIIVHVSSVEELYDVASEVPSKLIELTDRFWPGPLTFILKRKPKIVPEVSAGLETVAVRAPAHPVALSLIRLSGRPIAAPSANKSGKPSPTEAKHVLEDLGGEIPLILDAGKTFYGVESTVIDLTREPPVLLRPGAFPLEELQKILGKILVPSFARGFSEFEGEVISPGLKYRHYAPEKPLILVEGKDLVSNIRELLSQYKKAGLILSKETAHFFKDHENLMVLGSKEKLFEVAYNLFSSLREMDKRDVEVIIVEGIEEKGLGLAIMNRLRKAASKRITN